MQSVFKRGVLNDLSRDEPTKHSFTGMWILRPANLG